LNVTEQAEAEAVEEVPLEQADMAAEGEAEQWLGPAFLLTLCLPR